MPAGDPARRLALAFAPLHKRAFGMAIGLVSGLVVFLMTAIVILRGARGQFRLDLLSQYFTGYSVTWRGALIGFFWAAAAGFTAGWFLAFCRNFAIAILVFLVRTRADLARTKDFLDHI